MNEHLENLIKESKKVAGTLCITHRFTNEEIERFAQLVAEECIDIVLSISPDSLEVRNQIETRFGLK